jgi:hypothetical protein
MRQTWVLRNGGFQIPVGRAETTRKGEGEEEGVADDDHGNNTRKEKEGKRNGSGGIRFGATRKNREGGHTSRCWNGGECEGVTRGATGGQKRGRNERRRSQKGRMREVRRHADRQNG